MKYNVLYVDPPWSYRNKNTGGSMKSGSSAKYDVLTVEELCELPIRYVTEKDACLFLWVTVPLIPQGLQVMEAWGFKYKTSLFWRKIMSLGMGFWWRGQVECLFFGTRGNIKAFRTQKANIIQSKALKHSEKPEEFRKLIDESITTIDNPKKLELFGTKKVEGWEVIGREVDGLDIKDSLERLIEGSS